MKQRRNPQQFLHKHSLSLAALGVVVLLFALYRGSNPATHIGSFKGSAESKQPKGKVPSAVVEFLREHSLTLVLVITGIGWVLAFRAMDPGSKWGQVVGNIVSEWTQILGLVLMTKRLMEVGSKAR